MSAHAVAAHPVSPTRPACGRLVRSGVELQAAAADAEELPARVDRFRWASSADELELYERVTALVTRRSRSRPSSRACTSTAAPRPTSGARALGVHHAARKRGMLPSGGPHGSGDPRDTGVTTSRDVG